MVRQGPFVAQSETRVSCIVATSEPIAWSFRYSSLVLLSMYLIVVPELQEPAGTQDDSAFHLQHASYIQKE